MWTIRAWGPRACWTPVGLRMERFSAIAPSHAGCRGLLRGVLGKWGMTWNIHEVSILAPVRRSSEVINELRFEGKSLTRPTYIDDGQRTQRMTVFLRDVDYLIKASIALTKFADADDSLEKFEAMAERRFRIGQQRRHMYFGTKECMANVELVDDVSELPPPVDVTESLGLSYFDTDWQDPQEPAYFAPLNVVHGVLTYPSWAEVKALNIHRVTSGAA